MAAFLLKLQEKCAKPGHVNSLAAVFGDGGGTGLVAECSKCSPEDSLAGQPHIRRRHTCTLWGRG
ncbi:hypothetical protein E2C01_092905 [Portunus trituberculatus]|uniref:Uncharacterized protein n=1 Tax=Portunus trituberculatus TaxID=210409 RepID=A0A5B7JSM6_PORTR|nr:hypothetical protein [Portunus trituberculatus]